MPTWPQRVKYALIFATLLCLFLRDWKVFHACMVFALCLFYTLVIVFRLLSVAVAAARRSEIRVSAEEIAALRSEDLPVYTVLVPLYKEPEVARKIVAAIARLDYPADKLDVKLLLEEDDEVTIAKIREVSLPSNFEPVIIPRGFPRTKPRACNHGLARARGEYLVIYDAEDNPEPDQLKKAVAAFRKILDAEAGAGSRPGPARLLLGKPKRTVCLQAKLNYFNSRQNMLTKFFTLEYSVWFDLFLPGLHALGVPIPLGGTSNHFVTEALRQMGGWDPFNVTEDCDLGIRIARAGWRTQILDSTTWEEANSRVGNWIRQRSRWVKGYFQTHLVHTRYSWFAASVLAAVCLLAARTDLAYAPGSSMLFFSLAILNAAWIVWIAAADWRRYQQRELLGFLAGKEAVSESDLHQPVRVEGNLSPWQRLAFVFAVGGFSFMLLLNPIYWVASLLFLFRAHFAAALPSFADRIRFSGESLREIVSGWRLLYTEVTDERYFGRDMYNATWDLLSGRVNFAEYRDILAAIDDWSLVSQIFFPMAIGLLFANFVFVLLGLASCHRRKLWDLLPHALCMPAYWVLISIGAYKGLWQLLTDPFYWERTLHGLTAEDASAVLGAGGVRDPSIACSVWGAGGGKSSVGGGGGGASGAPNTSDSPGSSAAGG